MQLCEQRSAVISIPRGVCCCFSARVYFPEILSYRFPATLRLNFPLFTSTVVCPIDKLGRECSSHSTMVDGWWVEMGELFFASQSPIFRITCWCCKAPTGFSFLAPKFQLFRNSVINQTKRIIAKAHAPNQHKRTNVRRHAKLLPDLPRWKQITQSLFTGLDCRLFQNVHGCGKSLDSSFLVCPAWMLSTCLSHWLKIRLVRLVPNARRTLTDWLVWERERGWEWEGVRGGVCARIRKIPSSGWSAH